MTSQLPTGKTQPFTRPTGQQAINFKLILQNSQFTMTDLNGATA